MRILNSILISFCLTFPITSFAEEGGCDPNFSKCYEKKSEQYMQNRSTLKPGIEKAVKRAKDVGSAAVECLRCPVEEIDKGFKILDED